MRMPENAWGKPRLTTARKMSHVFFFSVFSSSISWFYIHSFFFFFFSSSSSSGVNEQNHFNTESWPVVQLTIVLHVGRSVDIQQCVACLE